MRVDSGLRAVRGLEWGAHFCHFYHDAAELAETLVPYFRTGLQANEACLWVTAEPFSTEAALAQLRVYFDDLDARISKGQLTVRDHAQWREDAGGAHAVNAWIDAKNKAVDRGFGGLRVSGNTAFVQREAWDEFNDYEQAIGDTFADQQIVALCSYPADRWDSDVTLDIVQSHDFALARRRARWEVFESASVRRTRAALARQQVLAAELSHRVKNSLASAQSLVDQSLRRASSPQEARAGVAGRLIALANAHEQLAAGEWSSASLRDILKRVGAAFDTKLQLDVGDQVLTARAALDLSLVFHELMTNAVKYGSLRGEQGSVSIQCSQAGANRPCTIVWTERGGPAVQPPTRKGFGTQLAEQLITQSLRGACEFAFEPEGLRCTLVIPATQLVRRGAGCVHGCARAAHHA